MADPDIQSPSAIFADASRKTLGVVTYEGDLHGQEPLEMHFNTEDRSLTVLFNSGAERPLSTDMSEEDVAKVSAMYKQLHENKADVKMAFIRVDADANIIEGYKVPVLMM